MIHRKAPMKRAWIRRRPRPRAQTIRCHGVPAFREWMKQQPCAVCGRTPSDAAHLKNGGLSRKADVKDTLPLCSDTFGYSGHHSEYDAGKKSFRVKYRHVDLEAKAAETHARWRALGG